MDNNAHANTDAWTEIEYPLTCQSPYLASPVLMSNEVSYWLCKNPDIRQQSRLTFVVFSQHDADDWEDDPMIGDIDVEILGESDEDVRPCRAINLGMDPNEFVKCVDEDRDKITFRLYWRYGKVTCSKGKQTDEGWVFDKACFTDGQTVSLLLTPKDEGQPFNIDLCIPEFGFGLTDKEGNKATSDLQLTPEQLHEYTYAFKGQPSDDRFSLSIKDSQQEILCIWHEDGMLTLRDHKEKLEFIGEIPAQGTLDLLLQQGTDVLVKYHNHRWNIRVVGCALGKEELPECDPTALARYAFERFKETDGADTDQLMKQLMGLETALDFQWCWLTEQDWSHEHLADLLQMDVLATQPEKMMEMALLYNRYEMFMKRMVSASFDLCDAIQGDPLQARNNKRKITRCAKYVVAHDLGETSMWERSEEHRQETRMFFRKYHREFVAKIEELKTLASVESDA